MGLEVVVGFTGYPGGVKTRFAPGPLPAGLDRDYVALLMRKGLVRAVRADGRKEAGHEAS